MTTTMMTMMTTIRAKKTATTVDGDDDDTDDDDDGDEDVGIVSDGAVKQVLVYDSVRLATPRELHQTNIGH